MKVNGELDQLQSVLPQVLDILETRGRLVVISFHSLEDHIVKHFMRRAAKGDYYPPELPVTHDQIVPELKLVSRPMRPGAQEVQRNSRARSAVLRTAEKISGTRP
jgi:16S rRNA (cytosine1402-N4)-methyltransferase